MAEDQAQSPLPLNADLAGYPSQEALVAGYRNSSNEGKAQRERADKLESLLVDLVSKSGSNSRQVPDRRSESPEDRLTQFGVPVDALNEYVGQAIQKAFAPITNGMNARGKVVSDHPDYVQFEADVAQFINNDPDLSQRYPRMFEADPVAAMEYAFLKFGDSRRREHGVANGDVGNRTDAAIPSNRAGEGRRIPDQSSELRNAYERFQKSGSTKDAEAYARIRLHSVIKDDHLNQ
jgi:hypothetical protein